MYLVLSARLAEVSSREAYLSSMARQGSESPCKGLIRGPASPFSAATGLWQLASSAWRVTFRSNLCSRAVFRIQQHVL